MFAFWKSKGEGLPPAAWDAGALSLLRLLSDAGFEAYVVGGCVRDLLLGRVPHDWDITTSARPEETVALLESAGLHGIDGGGRRFGTVIAPIAGVNYEITTFRREFYGEDAHRPTEVSFADSLTEDLSRRDFTVNAMAADADGVLYDPFGGARDLERRRLRTVGDAAERFSEDALRLFRACRFVAQLDFLADSSLVGGMESAFSRVLGLSLSRVKSELAKLLVAPHAARGLDLLVRTGLCETSCRLRENGRDTEIPILPELSHLVGLPQMKEFHKYDAWYHTLAVVEASPATEINRWAALLHDVGKGMPGVRAVEGDRITDHGHDHVGAEMAEAILSRLRFPSQEIRLITWLVRDHMKFHAYANTSSADVKKWVRKLAREKMFPSQQALLDAISHMTALSVADIIGCGRPNSATAGHEAFGACMTDVAREMPVTTKELDYDARTVLALSGCAAEGFSNLLYRVQAGSLRNDADALYHAAVQFVRRHG